MSPGPVASMLKGRSNHDRLTYHEYRVPVDAGVSGMGLGVFWAVWGVHGFFWALLYGFFWPVWFGYRAALYLLAQSLGPIVGGLT